MLRPCLECGYRSEPRDGGRCPECGAEALPPAWVVVELNIPRRAKVLMIGLAVAGLAAPLLMLLVGILLGANTLGGGCLGFFPLLFVPFLMRSLFSRRAMGMYVVTDDAIELRGQHGTLVHRRDEGWRVGSLRRDAGGPHHWLIEVRQETPSNPGRFEIPIDDRIDDPRQVEAAARRALGGPAAPAS